MRALLLLMVVAACTESGGECECVEYVVHSATPFDRLTVTFTDTGAMWTEDHLTTPTTAIDVTYYHPWDGPDSFAATAFDTTTIVGVGSVDLVYENDHGGLYARGTLELTPP